MLIFLDYFYTFLHSFIVIFVLTGWIWPGTRRLHVFFIIAILIAWFAIGLYKGVIGYCPLTDWHWDVKRSLGETDMPSSFTEYMAEKITGIDFEKKLVDGFTLGGLVFGVLMALYFQVINRLWRDQ